MPINKMFIRTKKAPNNRKYYYVVKSVRENNKDKQKVVKYLGKLPDLIKKLEVAENCLKNHK